MASPLDYSYLQKGQAGGSRELQPGQSYLYPWEDDGATNLENSSPEQGNSYSTDLDDLRWTDFIS